MSHSVRAGIKWFYTHGPGSYGKVIIQGRWVCAWGWRGRHAPNKESGPAAVDPHSKDQRRLVLVRSRANDDLYNIAPYNVTADHGTDGPAVAAVRIRGSRQSVAGDLSDAQKARVATGPPTMTETYCPYHVIIDMIRQTSCSDRTQAGKHRFDLRRGSGTAA